MQLLKMEDSEPCCSKSLPEINNNDEPRDNKRKAEDESSEESNKKWKSKESASQLKKCARLLKDFLTAKSHLRYTIYFAAPVDTELCQCPDYYDVIKNPMDLQTMQEKMDKKEYSTPEEFASDIRLILSNCCTYNDSPDHPIMPFCNRFRKEFEERYEKIIKPRQSELPSITFSDLSIRRSSRSFSQVSLPDDEDYLLSEIQATKDYLNKLYAKLDDVLCKKKEEEMRNKIPSTRKRNNKKKATKNANRKRDRKKANESAANKIKVEASETVKTENSATVVDVKSETALSRNLSSGSEDDYEPMTYDEKRELAQNVSKLPEEQLEILCEVVRIMEPENAINGKLKINFGSCSTETLRALEKYVHEYFHPKAPRAAPLPRKEKLEKDKNLVMELKQNLEVEKEECEKKLINIENQLGGAIRRTVPEKKPPSPKISSSSSSSSSGSSSSGSSSGSSSSSSSDSEND